jgi:acyl-CoA reductase-like NAD-dependent aldehyde dehydrogenase
VEKLIKRAAGFVPGDPLDPKTRLGPLVSAEQLDRVMGYIAQCCWAATGWR